MRGLELLHYLLLPFSLAAKEPMENYSTVKFLVRYGNYVAIVISSLPTVIGLGLLFSGYHWLVLFGGVAATAVLYLLLKSYVEIVCIIADMLLPK